MFYAASKSGNKFVAKREFRGEVIPAAKITYDKSEAFVFATAEEADKCAANLMRKDAGPAIEATPIVASKPVNAEYIPVLPRPTRHQREEAAIHGDHELYT